MFTWLLKKILGTSHERELQKITPYVEAICALEPTMVLLSEEALRAKTGELKEKVSRGASLDDLLVEAFAVCREGSKRALHMRHFDVQLIGGVVMHQGGIAEMRTGEGKTLAATLPCYLNALAGKGVHLVTVNDYLARRDAESMGKLYNFLGLSTGVILHAQSEREKKEAYGADITYGQNNEFGFDYLRDNMKFSALEYVQRPLHYAIVDEVDSILIDESRTPLIISGQGEPSSHKYKTLNEVIPRLRKDDHYVVDEKARTVSLTDEGVETAQKLVGISDLYDPVHLESLHILSQCLKAHALYKRDAQYLVSPEGKVLIVDEFTGRVLPGRRWSDGLHQAIEAKETVQIQEETRTMASITFQNLFRLYPKLAGMTGTADTEAEEFYSTYSLNVVAIPTNREVCRVDHEDLVYKTEREKFDAVVHEIVAYHERGQPVLVGTTSVDKSAAIARLLKKRGVSHAVLNAKEHEKEAYVVAQAGRKGAITVSTNMAGRGTDILLGGNPEMLARYDFKEQGRDPEEDPAGFEECVKRYEFTCKEAGEEVRALGGLHIVGTERHESRRIDNQLRGRAGRQGDPGSTRFYLSLEDDLMRIFGGERVKSLMERLGMPDNEPIEHPWVTKSILDAQRKVEWRNFDMRKHVLEYDDVLSEQRKAIYKIRQELLAGAYTPPVAVDPKGNATGGLRSIAPLPRLVEEVRDTLSDFMAPLPDGHASREGIEDLSGTEEEVRHLTLQEAEDLCTSIYHLWGYQVEPSSLVDRVDSEVYATLLPSVAQSLMEQRERLLDLVAGVVASMVEACCVRKGSPETWDLDRLRAGMQEQFGVVFNPATAPDILEELGQALYQQVETALEQKEAESGTALLVRVFRHFYLEELDQAWVDHLTNMEHLRDGIGLRGYGQRDPKQEYKKEGYDVFVDMMLSLASEVCGKVMQGSIKREAEMERIEEVDTQRHRMQEQSLLLQHGTDVSSAVPPRESRAVRRGHAVPSGRQKTSIGRNDLCPCGSGEKFKVCHGALLS